MNNLDYSISLREKGLSTNEIKLKLFEKGLDETQIHYYLKRSDEIYLNRLLQNKNQDWKSKGGIKIIILIVSLLLLASVFIGYATIGLLWLFIIWSLIGYSSFRK